MTYQDIINNVLLDEISFQQFLELNWVDNIPSHELSELYESIKIYNDDDSEFWTDYKKALIETLADLLKPL